MQASPQQLSVIHAPLNLSVLLHPGSGKTYMLTERIIALQRNEIIGNNAWD